MFPTHQQQRSLCGKLDQLFEKAPFAVMFVDGDGSVNYLSNMKHVYVRKMLKAVRRGLKSGKEPL